MAGPTHREFDVVLVGATGFVGRLTAAELARTAPATARIALAGRSIERLEALQAELGHPGDTWPTVLVDLLDAASVRALVERTRVVVTTAGPYATYGRLLVEACAVAGTHYADLTGETLFVRDLVTNLHDQAERSGARLVPSCGFDSIPSDLGVGLTATRVAADGDRLVSAVLHLRSARGGISGGTVDSMRQQIIAAQADSSVGPVLADPQALTGADPAPRSGHRHPQLDRDDHSGRWQAPFVMGGYNRQIVWRTNALGDWPYGRDFDYREVVDAGPGIAGLTRAAAISAGSNLLLGGMWLPPTRWVLDRLLPSPGSGPSEKTLQEGRFLIDVVGETAAGHRCRTRFGADLDPGYRGTAVMLVQSGLSLAFDALPDRGGVLTPMAAIGSTLADRLRRRGFTIETTRLDERRTDAQDHEVRQAQAE